MAELNYKIILEDNVETYVTYDVLSNIPKIQQIINIINNDVHILNKNVIHLHNININIFSSIVVILKYILANTNGKKSDFVTTILKNMNINELTDFILVANDLELNDIKSLGVETFKSTIQTNNIDKIREIYKINSGFTKDEEKQVIIDNEWTINHK